MEWQRAEQPVNVLTVGLTVECDHCVLPIPIAGPTCDLTCGHCSRGTKLTRLHEELVLANEGSRLLGSPYNQQRVDQRGPQCPKCDAIVAIDAWLPFYGVSTYFECPQCQAKLPTYPAPDWLRAQLPSVLQVFGGSTQVAASEGALPLVLDQEQSKPIAMACPQCAGGLLISATDARVTECRYCKTGVFLPDELWRQLHPIKTIVAWTISYSGRLASEETLRQERAEEAERERERQQAREERQREQELARLRAEEEAARALEQAAELKRTWIVSAVIVALSLGLVLAFSFLR